MTRHDDVLVEVADVCKSFTGIDAGLLPRVFERFARAHASRSDGSGTHRTSTPDCNRALIATLRLNPCVSHR